MSRVYIKYIKRTLPLKRLAILLAVSVLAIAAGFLIYSSISKDIQVIENGNLLAAKTMGKNVRQALERMNITLSKDDYVSMPLDAALDVHDLNIINIKRAVPVNLIVDGENKTIMTYRDTVEEVIDEVGITLGALDRFEGVNPSDPVEEGMDIRLVRVKEEIVAENEYIPYETIEKPNNVMNVETKVVTPGNTAY